MFKLKKILFLAFSLTMYFQLMAHDPAFSSFHLSHNKNTWTLRAEFPWSIRNALISTYPFLDQKGTSQEIFEDCLLEYIEQKIEIVIDENSLTIDRFFQVPGDHGHSFIYVFEMEGPESAKKISVNNYSMMEMYKKQRNHITVVQEDKSQSCVAINTFASCTFEF